MKEIKTKDLLKKSVKVLDKVAIGNERIKSTLTNIKQRTDEYEVQEANTNDYGTNKISLVTDKLVNQSVYNVNKIGKESVEITKNNVVDVKNKIRNVKSQFLSNEKLALKIGNGKIKSNASVIKNTKKLKSISKQQQSKKMIQRLTQKGVEYTKNFVKATIFAIKSIVIGTKALIVALLAGGWIVLVIILFICLIAMLFGSIFGIFFSSEDTGTGVTMNDVVTEINNDMASKLKNIQNENEHDNVIIESDLAEWKNVLAIYTVKVSDGKNDVDVMGLDSKKVKTLKEVYWKMNNIDYKVVKQDDEDSEEEDIKKILKITINSKSINEMMEFYDFNSKQRKQVQELLSEEYETLWSSVIYGTSVGSPDIVQIALSQVGNVGGQPYWSWYGFNSRVEWCAVFVSWVADQAGYIKTGIIPKFSACKTGVNWFKAIGRWKSPGFVPKAGDIIFFDWEVDGRVNHVGIVEKVENNRVYTIEGNSTNDTCRQKSYSINSKVIFGYGTPAY